MRFYLTFEPEGVLTLPLAHHHILQGFIYSVISSKKTTVNFYMNKATVHPEVLLNFLLLVH